jgi:NAD(P)-dependent dehydrogenase (short-subunit alcohol dehydrogenase family)
MTVHGTSILVVGGSSGIGLAAAQAAGREGARVTIASRSKAKLDDAAARIEGDVATLSMDIADETSVKTALADSHYDHILITAAPAVIGPLKDLPTEEAMRLFEIKFWGAYRVAKHASLSEGGSITFTSGTFSRRPMPGSSAYSAANAALEGFTRALALELAPIRANCVCPGMVDTKIHLQYMQSEEQRQGMMEQVASSIPLSRVAQPEEIAHAILFLMANPHTSGEVLVVDGAGVLG